LLIVAAANLIEHAVLDQSAFVVMQTVNIIIDFSVRFRIDAGLNGKDAIRFLKP